MFKALFGQGKLKTYAHVLYGTVVARARDPYFYNTLGVPDTFDGRFEMLAMHLFMLHYRLKDEKPLARQVSQRIFDCFIDDMDSALREAAVGDQGVPKRIAKMTRVFYGRTGAYESALLESEPEKQLALVIERNLYPDGGSKGGEQALAQYLFSQIHALDMKTADEIVKENMVFKSSIAAGAGRDE